jgi:hypothetical protein
VVLDDGGIPADASAFENLSFVEAEVGEHNDETAKVTIRSVASLGEWARRAWLPNKAGFAEVPEPLRPADDVLTPLRDALRARESVVWTAGAGATGAIRAVGLLKCDSDRRAVVLCDTGAPSYLVRL